MISYYDVMLPGGEADHGAWSQHLPAQLGVSTHSLGKLYKLSLSISVYIVTPAVDDQAGVCNQYYGSGEN